MDRLVDGVIYSIEAIPVPERITWRMYSSEHIYLLGPLLDDCGARGWALYRAVMSRPPAVKVGGIYITTRKEQIRWWIRCKLVKWGII